MKKLILLLSLFLSISCNVLSQGCIAIRSIAGFGQDIPFESIRPGDKWIMNVNNRYFKASRSFKGTTDQHHTADSQAVMNIYALSFSVTRILDKGWSLSFNLPISANSRETSGEHRGLGNLPKHTTRAFGIGDIRITGYKWLLKPSSKVNIQIGLGIKLPTGDYRYQDYYIRNDTTKVLAPVDQSIQLGDGGTGIISELNTYYNLNHSINLFANFYYLLNPREQNGVSNLKGRAATPVQKANGSTEMSVPDQYTIRAGANFIFSDLVLSAGARYERVPSEDLIGGSNGFRRAGYIISVEPGLKHKTENATIYVYTAIPFKRSTIQTIPDKITSSAGVYTITEGGFADYLIFAGVTFKL